MAPVNSPEKEKSKASISNQSSDKLLQLVEFLSEQEEPLRLLDIARQTGMNQSTASRFLSALKNRGYVAQNSQNGKYSLTYKICRIANNVSSRMDTRHVSLPYLRELSKVFGCTSNLVVEYDLSVMYLEVVAGPRQMLVPLQRIGIVAPLHCTSGGKLLLTEFSEEKFQELLRLKGLPKYTNRTITNEDALRHEVEEARRLGYAFDNEECELGTRCVAAPLRDFSGRIVGAVSVNGPIVRMTDDYIQQKLPHLISIAGEISAHLGYEGASLPVFTD